jgi:hypothetical protein
MPNPEGRLSNVFLAANMFSDRFPSAIFTNTLLANLELLANLTGNTLEVWHSTAERVFARALPEFL